MEEYPAWLNDQNFDPFETARRISPFLQAMIWHIDNIVKSENKEEIEMSIRALENLNENIPFGKMSIPIREAIRIGRGDFAKIQKKCIQLGLVKEE